MAFALQSHRHTAEYHIQGQHVTCIGTLNVPSTKGWLLFADCKITIHIRQVLYAGYRTLSKRSSKRQVVNGRPSWGKGQILDIRIVLLREEGATEVSIQVLNGRKVSVSMSLGSDTPSAFRSVCNALGTRSTSKFRLRNKGNQLRLRKSRYCCPPQGHR